MSVLFICHEFTNKEVQTDRELSSANLSGANSISKPRLPALTQIVSCSAALSCKKVGKAFFCLVANSTNDITCGLLGDFRISISAFLPSLLSPPVLGSAFDQQG